MPIHLKTLEHVVVYVSDMQRSVAFYRDTLGLERESDFALKVVIPASSGP